MHNRCSVNGMFKQMTFKTELISFIPYILFLCVASPFQATQES